MFPYMILSDYHIKTRGHDLKPCLNPGILWTTLSQTPWVIHIWVYYGQLWVRLHGSFTSGYIMDNFESDSIGNSHPGILWTTLSQTPLVIHIRVYYGQLWVRLHGSFISGYIMDNFESDSMGHSYPGKLWTTLSQTPWVIHIAKSESPKSK